MASFIAGLDLAQASDYSALTVVEHVVSRTLAKDEEMGRWVVVEHGDLFELRFARRWRGTPYPQVVDQVANILRPLFGDVVLLFDRTGLGSVVADLLNDARRDGRLARWPVPVTITSGADDSDLTKAPKTSLLQNLEVLAEQGRLRIADALPLAPVIRSELQAFTVTTRATGSLLMEGAHGAHDDLVLSLALAVWPAKDRASLRYCSRGTRRVLSAAGELVGR